MTLLSVSLPGSVGTTTTHSTVLPHNKMKKTREVNEGSSEELRKGLFSCLPVRGHSIITWILVFPFLTSTWTIFNQKVDKNRYLLTTYPPQSAHVIFEWPLTPPAGKLWSFTKNQSLVLDFLEYFQVIIFPSISSRGLRGRNFLILFHRELSLWLKYFDFFYKRKMQAQLQLQNTKKLLK